MLTMASFFALIVQPSAQANISRTISRTGLLGVARLAQLDEVGVLGEAAGVEEERHAVLAADVGDRRGCWPSRPAGRRRSCS